MTEDFNNSFATNDTVMLTSTPTVYIASSVGFALGILYSLINKRSFWAYVGFGIAGSTLGTATGMIIQNTKK